MNEGVYFCVGICLPDAEEAYCIGCGRPWGAPVPAQPEAPPAVPATEDDAPATAA